MIRISRRGKIGLSALAAVIVAGALAALVVVPLGPLSHTAHAAPSASTVSYKGQFGQVSTTAKGNQLPTNVKANGPEIACDNDTNIPASQENCTGLSGDGDAAISGTLSGDDDIIGSSHKPMLHRPATKTPFNGGTKAAISSRAPSVTGMSKSGTGSALVNFNGVSNDDNATANGFVLTPPDQGLCVGPASAFAGSGLTLGVSGKSSIVVEPVNDSMDIYSSTGAILAGPISLSAVFNDPDSDGDVSCQYDPGTHTFFFTEIGVLLDATSPDFGQVITDIAVINASGYAAYQLDTSVGGTCFPDFPHQGYNNNAFYLTVDQFDCGPASEGGYAGVMVWGLSKSQLAGLSSSVNFVTFGPLSLNGTETLAIAPAFGDFSSTEYMANSFPYDAFGNDNNIANSLGFWTVTGGKNITTGSGTVTLTGSVISSETYAFPQEAASTGNGSVDSNGETSEAFLNPDDSRMEQLQLVNTSNGLRLFSSLDTAVNISGDPTARDGAAWFEFNPAKAKVVSQGYIAVAGTYLLYPSILVANNGASVIDFSMTSPTMNPSTGYVFSKSSGKSYGAVQTTAIGSGAHISFSDFFFGEARWGDYSAAALDPSSGNIWVGDEYIPPTSTNGFDNWGTRVWEVGA